MTDAEHDRLRELITKARNTEKLSKAEKLELARLMKKAEEAVS